MPELPEVQTVVSELNRKLKNRKIKKIDVHNSKVISVGPKTVSNIRSVTQKTVNEFVKFLTGRKILSVRRRAKMLIFDVDGPLSMLVHLKMTGQFIFEDKQMKKQTGSQYRILNKLTAPLVKLPSKFTHVVFISRMAQLCITTMCASLVICAWWKMQTYRRCPRIKRIWP
jgi:formamidopyrimidine-DNA glycosylase